MKIAVVGMEHLGSVTGACLASVGHFITGFDSRLEVLEKIQFYPDGVEPGLSELCARAHSKGCSIYLTADRRKLSGNEIVWVCYDTPVDECGNGAPNIIIEFVCSLLSYMDEQTLLIVSSQLPVGSVRKIEQEIQRIGKSISVACIPENLRRGKAIPVFMKPDRFVIGVRNPTDALRISGMLQPPICDGQKLLFTSIEAAEMIKHAINAFLSVEITFINELARICSKLGIPVEQVEAGLKSDQRIGPLAYLKAGGPYTEKTLGRDMKYLRSLAYQLDISIPLLEGTIRSHEESINAS